MTETKIKRTMAPYPPRKKKKLRGRLIQSFYGNPGQYEMIEGLSLLRQVNTSDLLREMATSYLEGLPDTTRQAAMSAYSQAQVIEP